MFTKKIEVFFPAGIITVVLQIACAIPDLFGKKKSILGSAYLLPNIVYLLTGYPVRTEKYKPEVT